MTEKEKQLPAEEEQEGRKKKLLMGAVALVTSAGLLLGGLFHSPEALLAPEQPLEPVALVQNDDDGDPTDPEGDGEDEDELKDSRSGETTRSLRARWQERISNLPYLLRLLVLLPLWALGWLIQTGATALWSALLGPVFGKILGWVFGLAAILGALVLGVKARYPDLPIREIVKSLGKKKNRRILAAGAGALALTDLLLLVFWEDYGRYELLIYALETLLALGAGYGLLTGQEHRRRRAEEKAAAKAPVPKEEAPRPLGRAELLAIADEAARKPR